MQEIKQDDLTFKYFTQFRMLNLCLPFLLGEFEFPAALHDTGSIYLD